MPAARGPPAKAPAARSAYSAAVANLAQLLLPDFLLILLGFVVCRYTALDRARLGRGREPRLLPALPGAAVQLDPAQPARPGARPSSLGAGRRRRCWRSASRVALRASAAGPASTRACTPSGAQVAFRFNSFIALALAERLAGAAGPGWIALLIGALRAALQRRRGLAAGAPRRPAPTAARSAAQPADHQHRRSAWSANLAGLCCCPSRWRRRCSASAWPPLPLGLMAVGAGLHLGGLKAAPGLAASLLAIRHALLPAVAIGLALLLRLPPEQRSDRRRCSRALPTASSAYVLAARMGGDGGFVAGLVTVSTVLGMVSLPLWLAVLGLRLAELRARPAPRSAGACASAQSMCSRTSGLARSRRAAQRRDDRGIAARPQGVAERRPRGCAASARGRCGGSRCLRCGAGTRPRPRPTARAATARRTPSRASKSGSGLRCAYLFQGQTSWQSSQP